MIWQIFLIVLYFFIPIHAAVIISSSDLVDQTKQKTLEYFKRQGYEYEFIPVFFVSLIENKIDAIVKTLRFCMDREERAFIYLSELEKLIDVQMQELLASMQGIVLNKDLSVRIKILIDDFIKDQGINIKLISSDYYDEYLKKMKKIEQLMHDIIKKDNRMYLRLYEINMVIKNQMLDFCSNLKKKYIFRTINF